MKENEMRALARDVAVAEAVLCAVCGEPKGMHYVMDPPRDAVCPNRRGESDFAPSRPSVDAREPADAESYIAGMRRELDRVSADLRMHQQKALGEYWVWQGDGTDHPESLSCPVLIHADDLRKLLAAALQAQTKEGA
jgi:hypothetical protein